MMPVTPVVDGVDWGLMEPTEGFVISLGICRYIAAGVGMFPHTHTSSNREVSTAISQVQKITY
jgi:hypothetical protein